MRATLSSRIALVVILIIGSGVALTVMLNYFKLAQTLSAVAETRLAFTARDLRSRIEAGLDLGLDLGSMANVQQIVDNEAAGDPKILAIMVFDADGKVLFAAGRQAATAEGTVRAAWLSSAGRSVDWRAELPGSLVVGSRLTNDFGATAGGVALVYSRAAMDLLLDSVLAVLAPVGLVLVLVAVLLAWLIAALLFRGTERRLRGMRLAVDALLEPGSTAAVASTDPELAPMRERLDRTLGTFREAGSRLADLAHDG